MTFRTVLSHYIPITLMECDINMEQGAVKRPSQPNPFKCILL